MLPDFQNNNYLIIIRKHLEFGLSILPSGSPVLQFLQNTVLKNSLLLYLHYLITLNSQMFEAITCLLSSIRYLITLKVWAGYKGQI
jgi:hypothetical protein